MRSVHSTIIMICYLASYESVHHVMFSSDKTTSKTRQTAEAAQQQDNSNTKYEICLAIVFSFFSM